MKSIFHEIRTLYDAGIPIFTKDDIRKVGEELQRFQKGERDSGGNIILKGVNGVDYEIFVHPPSLRRPRVNQVLGGSKWVIRYYSIESLTTYTSPDLHLFDPQLAYLPMQIHAPIRLLTNFDHSIDQKPPAPPTEDLSTYQAIEQQWKTSQHYTQLQEILTAIEIPFTLTKVIALALGPLIVRSQINKGRFLQHALVSALHSILVHRGILSASSEKYVQDPGYTQRDKDVIHSAGLTVLNDPEALLELDESSVLVSIAADIPVGDIVADICRPGIIIWDDRDREGLYPPLGPKVKRMIRNEYSEISFPHYDECFGALRMVMLIRKST
ncbi:putative SRR1 like protein [Rosellinia necatrix]|uniref:Putative SRR1 like protein n=1 Tax=Rosellinia necatrix TaxID=77044 RepID=A0A1W2TH72_ROSNE|nr:putative SRR1 like protein [Rosellinia necatrix]